MLKEQKQQLFQTSVLGESSAAADGDDSNGSSNNKGGSSSRRLRTQAVAMGLFMVAAMLVHWNSESRRYMMTAAHHPLDKKVFSTGSLKKSANSATSLHTRLNFINEDDFQQDEEFRQTQLELQSQIKDTLNQTDIPLAPRTLGAFLHLGKTGGSTVCSQMRYACHSFVRKPCIDPAQIHNESYVSKLTTYIHVPDFPKLQDPTKTLYHNYDFYVVTLRDVYARFLSAFTFMHPLNPFEKRRNTDKIFSCFPTLQSFADYLGNDDDNDNEDNNNNNSALQVSEEDFFQDASTLDMDMDDIHCTQLARSLLNNDPVAMHAASHFYYDTKLVMNWANISDTTPILSLRTEHLWEDWTSANAWLGQDLETIAIFPQVTVRVFETEQYAVTKDINEQGQRRLCKALVPEYSVYLRTIQRSVNLSPQDKTNAFALALKHCGPELEPILPAILKGEESL